MIYWIATVKIINEDSVGNNNLHLHVCKPKFSICSTTVNEKICKRQWVMCLNMINVEVLPSTEMSWEEDDTTKIKERRGNVWGNRMHSSCFTDITCSVSL